MSRLTSASSGVPDAASRPSSSKPAQPLQDEIVEKRAGRAGVEGDHRLAVDIGDIADAAEVEHHHGLVERAAKARW